MSDGIVVSVVMANYQGASYLAAAIASVQAQTLTAWELIISDDGSTDASLQIAHAAADTDSRISVIIAPQTRGPGAARNAAFAAARGDWIAILDSDDLMHPERLARLLAAADRLDAGMIADDMVLFGEGPGTGGRTLMQGLALRAPLLIPPGLFIQGDGTSTDLPAFGYLKPMIRRSLLDGLRYDESLRVGEDFDLCLRLLLNGARYLALPDPMYLYRRHAASVSHRLSVPLVASMIAAHDRLPAAALSADRAALARRRLGLERLLAYEHLVAAIKARDAGGALRMLTQRPALIRPLLGSIAERLGRKRLGAVVRTDKDVVLGMARSSHSDDPAFVAVIQQPQPGLDWSAPPAPMAARLSALSGQHRLRASAADEAGLWAMGLIPAGL